MRDNLPLFALGLAAPAQSKCLGRKKIQAPGRRDNTESFLLQVHSGSTEPCELAPVNWTEERMLGSPQSEGEELPAWLIVTLHKVETKDAGI